MLDVTPGRLPNVVRFVFRHPGARAVYPEWRAAADEQAGRLRRALTVWSHEASVRDLVDELLDEPEFEVRWNAHPVDEERRGTKVLTHPEVGDVAIADEVLDVADDSGQQLITWLPADDETAARLATLTGAPRLRLVEGR